MHLYILELLTIATCVTNFYRPTTLQEEIGDDVKRNYDHTTN